ncbi:MAG: hypothetical protein ACR5LA_04695 [Wolbachia sp.]
MLSVIADFASNTKVSSQCPDTGIQPLIVILVNKSGKNKRSSQNAVFLLK